MPGPRPLVIRLSDDEREYLEKTVRKRTAAQREVTRAQIVLLAAEGLTNAAIGRRLQCARYTVWQWRKRFFHDRLQGLADRPRPGRRGVFSPSAAP